METLAQLIDSVGIDAFGRAVKAKPRTVRSWRAGDRNPRPRAAKRIVAAFPQRIDMSGIYGGAPRRCA